MSDITDLMTSEHGVELIKNMLFSLVDSSIITQGVTGVNPLVSVELLDVLIEVTDDL